MRSLIRLADASDIENIASLVELYWQFENIAGFDRPRITALLKDFLTHPERGQCWVAEEGGRLTGYLLAVYLFSLEYGGVMAEIDEFFVTPEKRSSHIGSSLLDAATRAMTQAGITRLQLQLGSRNSNGKRFYEHHGFRMLLRFDVLTKELASKT